MTVQQLHILHQLHKRGTMTATQLGSACFFSLNSCTRMLVEMVDAGLVSCEPLEFDKRVKLYKLTAAGAQIVKNAEQKADSEGHLLDESLEVWTNDRRRLSKCRRVMSGWLS